MTDTSGLLALFRDGWPDLDWAQPGKGDTLNQVLHGDCLELMKGLPDKSIDMICCDLPYGTTSCHWDTIIPFEPLWAQYKRLIKDNGAIVLFGSQPFTSKLIMSNIKMFKYEWVWNKGRGFEPQLANIRPQKAHENIIVFGDGRIKYYPIKSNCIRDKRRGSGRENNRKDGSGLNIMGGCKTIGLKYYDDRFPISVIEYDNSQQAKKEHPTQKPVALISYLIRTYTQEGETVLDNCAGSGTTAIACINTKRNYILIEKEQKYIDIIHKRIDEHTRQQVLF